MEKTPSAFFQGFLHDLALQTLDLESTLRTTLLGSNNPLPHHGSVLRLFRDRTSQAQGLPETTLLELLGSSLKAVDFFSLTIANYLGYLTQELVLEPRREPLEISEILGDAVDSLQDRAADRGISIRLNDHAAGAVLSLDRLLIHRALVNVLHNAIEYSHAGPGKAITVEVRRHSMQGAHLLEISSIGVGILPEELRTGSIFRYGVRGVLAADLHRYGSGIGLPESRRIVEAHGGALEIDSKALASTIYLTTARVVLAPTVE